MGVFRRFTGMKKNGAYDRRTSVGKTALFVEIVITIICIVYVVYSFNNGDYGNAIAPAIIGLCTGWVVKDSFK